MISQGFTNLAAAFERGHRVDIYSILKSKEQVVYFDLSEVWIIQGHTRYFYMDGDFPVTSWDFNGFKVTVWSAFGNSDFGISCSYTNEWSFMKSFWEDYIYSKYLDTIIPYFVCLYALGEQMWKVWLWLYGDPGSSYCPRDGSPRENR